VHAVSLQLVHAIQPLIFSQLMAAGVQMRTLYVVGGTLSNGNQVANLLLSWESFMAWETGGMEELWGRAGRIECVYACLRKLV